MIPDKSLWKALKELMRKMGSNLKSKAWVNCKYCGSTDVVKFGTHKGIQRWWCKNCKRKFVDADTLFKMKTPIHQIASALSGYYRGMSLDKIGEHLDQQYDNRLTDAGIYNWVVRFTKDAIDYTKALKPDVGDVWVADETVLKIGGKNIWFWDIIDAKTRFLLASHLSTTRTTKDAYALMKMAEQRAGKIPELVFTDKLLAYLDGIELAWGAETKHLPSKGFRAPLNTNMIERFHGSLKDRIKVMRGLRNVKTAKLLLDGWLVHYNFFRPHESLNDRTPAEKAGIKTPIKNWADVVRAKEDKPVDMLETDEPPIEVFEARASPRIKHKHKKARKRAKREKVNITVKGLR